MSKPITREADSRRPPPLRARLYRYKLSSSELSVLQAMCEHCSSGETIWVSISRLAAYTKLSERQVQRIIGARPNGQPPWPGSLLARHILRELAPANSKNRSRPATYAINESALREDPTVMRYVRRQSQCTLPGFNVPSAPGERILDEYEPTQRVTPRHQTLVTLCHQSGDTMSPNPNPNDSEAGDGIQHGDAALNSLPAWCALKEQLRNELSVDEWNRWVRPMLLLRVLPLGPGQKHLLAAIPPSSRIEAAALSRLPLMRELLRPAGYNLSLTKYPDEWQISEAHRRYGKDIAPKPWMRRGSA